MPKILDLLQFPIAVIIILAIVMSILKLILAGRKPSHPSFPYKAISSLFTPAEQSFLAVLDPLISSDYWVFGKVRAADVMEVTKGMGHRVWQQAFNRIQSKHFDFVICRASDSAIRLLIELDDKSHDNSRRIERDAFIEQAAKAAGVPLLRIRCKRNYRPSELAALVEPHLPSIDPKNSSRTSESSWKANRGLQE
jgi:hypothetical protein